jgi:hypothetical protein
MNQLHVTEYLERLIVAQLVNKLPAYYVSRNFITVRFQVLTAASKKLTVFWVAAPCGLTVSARLHGATSQETVIFVYSARQLNPFHSVTCCFSKDLLVLVMEKLNDCGRWRQD